MKPSTFKNISINNYCKTCSTNCKECKKNPKECIKCNENKILYYGCRDSCPRNT